MKALPSIAFSEFSGSAGDVTARSIGGRTLLNHKAYQSKVKTPAQAVSCNTLSKVSRAYKQLTDSQMKAWGTLAQHLKGVSNGWSKVVVVSPGMIDNWGDAAMTQLYTDKIGFLPQVGSKVFGDSDCF